MSEKNILYDIASNAGELLTKHPANNVLQLEPEVSPDVELFFAQFISINTFQSEFVFSCFSRCRQ